MNDVYLEKKNQTSQSMQKKTNNILNYVERFKVSTLLMVMFNM
jgi:hypothetical protein